MYYKISIKEQVSISILIITHKLIFVNNIVKICEIIYKNFLIEHSIECWQTSYVFWKWNFSSTPKAYYLYDYAVISSSDSVILDSSFLKNLL